MIVGATNDGGAVTTALSSAATAGALDVSSTSTGPALKATGHPVAAGGAVALAGNGPALAVRGAASFTRSGRFTLPVGAQTFAVDVPGGVTTKSIVLATLQNVSTGATIKSASRNVSTGKITVTVLSPAPAFPLRPSWAGWSSTFPDPWPPAHSCQ